MMINKLIVRLGHWLIRVGSDMPTVFTNQQHIDQLIAINHSYQKKFKEFGKAQGALGNKQGELEKRVDAIEQIAAKAIYTSGWTPEKIDSVTRLPGDRA